MTATSIAAGLVARTREVEPPGDLLDSLSPDGFAWLTDGSGFVTSGVAARVRRAPADPGLVDARQAHAAGAPFPVRPALDLVNAGAKWEDAEVVVDDNLVTSRKPEDLPAFCKASIEVVERVPARA